MKRLALLLIPALILLSCGALAAQGSKSALESDLMVEARMLDTEIANYERSRAREQATLERYIRMSREFDETIKGDPELQLFREMEADLAREREALVAAMNETARIRERGLGVAERIRAIFEQMEAVEANRLVRSAPIDGFWHVEIHTSGITGGMQVGTPEVEGTMKLAVDGAMIRGEYRMDGGGSGSLSGTYGGTTIPGQGGKIQLRSFSPVEGFNYTLEGDYDEAADEIRGTYRAVLLNQGGRATGRWEATRVPWMER